MIVVITGTCAVGKSTVARLLEKEISGKVKHIHVDRKRFTLDKPHNHASARRAHQLCFQEALELEKKGYFVILQGNYIFSDLKSLYGDAVTYVHLHANLFTILSRHVHRKKKHPLSMIIGSWFVNYFLFRKSLNTTRLREKETVKRIMRRIYKR